MHSHLSIGQSLWSRMAAAALVAVSMSVAFAACTRSTETSAGYSSTDTNDCLPANISLVDQFGKKVSLASLKGKPVLFDFIYTTCPGPCLMLTSRMRLIANRLGPMLGSKVTFVSVTVDPEHDGVAQLLDYSKQQGADRNGWLFLTGPPADVERLMALFKLRRQREADGTVDHVLEFFLVGADGRQLYQYAASHTEPDTIARDVEHAVQTNTMAGTGEPPVQAHL